CAVVERADRGVRPARLVQVDGEVGRALVSRAVEEGIEIGAYGGGWGRDEAEPVPVGVERRRGGVERLLPGVADEGAGERASSELVVALDRDGDTGRPPRRVQGEDDVVEVPLARGLL